MTRIFAGLLCRRLPALALAIVAGLFLTAGFLHRSDVSQDAHLLLTSIEIHAGSTFELRFDQPVAPDTDVGTVAARSPLRIEPPLDGSFVWRSRRSGLFVPKRPLELATEYRFSLRPDLRTADGIPLKARLLRTFKTPPLTLDVHRIGWWETNRPPALPIFQVSANAALREEDLIRHARFRNGSTVVSAEIVRMTNRVDWWTPLPESWFSHFRSEPEAPDGTRIARRIAKRAQSFAEREGNPFFRVLPSKPLPSGKQWVLEIRSGVGSTETAVCTATPTIEPVGNIPPPGISSISANNPQWAARSLVLRLNRPMDPSLTNSLPLKWIHCLPMVSNLHCLTTSGGTLIELGGDFELHCPYQLTVDPGLPAENGDRLAAAFKTNFEFQPIPPTAWLADFDTVQLMDGRRELEVLAVNTPQVLLRLKQLDATTLIHTLRAYERYRGSSRDPLSPPADRLDFAGIAGRTIVSTNLPTRADEDQSARVAVGWDALLKSTHGGAFFVDVDVPAARTNGTRSYWGQRSNAQGPQAIVQLTDLGMEIKEGKGTTAVYVFSHRTGGPLGGVRVSLRTEENEVLETGMTGPDGVVTLPRRLRPHRLGRPYFQLDGFGEKSSGEPSEAWVLAELGADLHAQRLGQGGMYLGRYGLPDDWDSSDPLIFVFGDRDAYRPGDTLHLKALVRHWTDHGWDYPTNNEVHLKLSDPGEIVVLETNLVIHSGSAEWTSILPTGRRGRYQARFTVGGVSHDHTFEVRDFRPPAFEVKLGSQTNYLTTDVVDVALSARYLLGADLQRAMVHWSLDADPVDFAPEGWGAFTFCQSGEDWQERQWRLKGQRSQTITLNGSTSITNPAPVHILPALPASDPVLSPRSVSLAAEVTDLNQQTVSHSVGFTRNSSDFYLGVRWKQGEEAILATNQPLDFELVAVGTDGKPVAAQKSVAVELQKVEWRTVRVQGAGKTVDYRSEPEFLTITNLTLTTEAVCKAGTEWKVIHDAPLAGYQFPALTESGQYLIVCHSEDKGGRRVETRMSFHISGDGRIAWNYKNGSVLALVSDKQTYQPGDTARILLEVPFDGTAWITLERESVRKSFSREVRAGAPEIEVPLTHGDSPNVTVGVSLIRGHAHSPREFPMPESRIGFLNLTVIDPADRLGVLVTPSRKDYLPGDEVAVAVQVSDLKGGPVAGADLAVYAVDEGFLQMTGSPVPDPFQALHRAHPLEVDTTLSLPELISENPELRRFQNKGANGGGGGRSGLLRKNFVPCPFWNGQLVADASGHVEVRFKAPDSLTRYRVVAVATHGPKQSGSSASTFEVRKGLMIEPSVPRFVHSGDRLIARALVLNQSTNDLSVTASLNLGTNQTRLASGALTTHLALAGGQTTFVEFPIQFAAVGEGEWQWTVEAEGPAPLRDAVQSRVTVIAAEADMREIRHLTLTNLPVSFLADIQPELLQGEGTVHVRWSDSPLAFLAEGAGKLLHYPYGCVEQTGSSLIPWLALRDFPELLPQEARTPESARTPLIVGVDRLFSMQTIAGGLSYWPGDSSPHDWGSAYGGLVLALVRDAGIPVPERRLNVLYDWLGKRWKESSETNGMTLSERCLTGCALAFGRGGDTSLNRTLFEQRDRLSSEERALLSLAISHSRGDNHQALAFLVPSKVSGSQPGLFGNAARVLAIRLLATLAVAPETSEVDALVEQLLTAQRRGHWDTTQGDAWALWALSEFGRHRTGRTPATLLLTTPLGSKTLTLDKEHRIGEWTARLRHETNPGGWRSQSQSGGPIFVEVSVSAHPTNAARLLSPVDHGFSLRRRYERLDNENHPHAVGGWHVGDRVLITLELDAPDGGAWIAIEDPMPSVLEPIYGVFKTEASGVLAFLPSWMADFQEFRQERNLIFRNLLPEGQHTVRYLARVRAAGSALAAPAKVEAMYEPDRYGFSSGERFEATAER